jgi:hypothetical protein
MNGIPPMEALIKVAKNTGQSPLELLSILTPSEAIPYWNDLQQRIQNYRNLGIYTLDAWAKVARDIDISQEMVEKIITVYPHNSISGENRSFDSSNWLIKLWKDIKNDLLDNINNYTEILIGSILISVAIFYLAGSIKWVGNLIYGYTQIYPSDLSIGIFILLIGAFLFAKGIKEHFTKT